MPEEKTAQEDKPEKKKKEEDPVKKKTRRRLYIAGGVLAFVGLVLWWGFQPLRGPMPYGVCRVFAELQIRYPETMELTDAYAFQNAWRIFYTYRDPYGYFKSDMIECVYNYSGQGVSLEAVKINRDPVDSEEVAAFNKTIPAIVAAGPDLVLPWQPDGDSLMALKPEED